MPIKAKSFFTFGVALLAIQYTYCPTSPHYLHIKNSIFINDFIYVCVHVCFQFNSSNKLFVTIYVKIKGYVEVVYNFVDLIYLVRNFYFKILM